MITMRCSVGEICDRAVGRTAGQVRQSVASRIMAVARGQWSCHHTGGGHTPSSHTSARTDVPSASPRPFLGFASAMSLDHSALRNRLQQALGDEFTVGTLLGEGGFAVVYRVRDDALRRDVAVKVLDLGLTPSPVLAERFVREARTVARLEHPNIVPIYKVGGYKNEVLYIIMRCVDGPSLRQLLEQHPRLSVGDAARVARQVADALAHAHARGVIHRDIKPDNILLDATGRVLVTDFGIAKATEAASGSQLTTEGMVIGTPQYMSPEQATGDRVDSRSDIYSLGVLLYQMLAGAPPFDGESAQSILMKQATASPEPLRDLRSDVSAELAAVVDRSLAKDPAERFSTAQELSRALVQVLPTAAGDRVKVRRGLGSLAVESLVRIVLVGCLVAIAFVAGAVVVTWTVFSRRRVAVAGPRHRRSYPRDSVAYTLGARWRSGPQFLFVLIPARGRRDTVFTSLSPRGAWSLARAVDQLLPQDSVPGGFHIRFDEGPGPVRVRVGRRAKPR